MLAQLRFDASPIASNDNTATSPSRDHLRAAILLVWWEAELARLYADRASTADLAEAQDKVRAFRREIPAELLASSRAWARGQR